MLGLFKKAVGDKMKAFSGQKDFLEAVCAASALVAAADGNIEDSEIEAMVKSIAANPLLSSNYNSREIEQVANTMLERAAKGGRMGRMGLMREIEEACSDPDKAEAILLAALDVAEGDGSIDDKEMSVLQNIASKISLDLKKYL